MTYTEVDRVEGEAGDFDVTLVKKARYIREDKCTGCTTCVEYCPVKIPDPFNQEISKNKAIHIYFAQAIPLITYIDENCLYIKERKCRICEAVCEKGAIDFTIREERLKINVGAIIISAGFEPFNPKVRDEYGYGRMKNLITSMDYERILSSTGPYEGEIRRNSDLKNPSKVAWIQCVGSRRVTKGDNMYCSAICCTFTQKQVILTKEHYPEMECVVFHNDIRAHGKDFERFYRRANSLPGVRFIRSYVSIVREVTETSNIVIRYATENGVEEEEFQMVVLSVGFNPPENAKELVNKFGIELNEHGFCKTNPLNPLETTRAGVYVTGAFRGPSDIPESVFSGSGSASLCGELLQRRRGKLTKRRIYPEERDCSREEPRVGVFVCYCGANIGRTIDVPALAEYASMLPYVVHVEKQLFSCSTDSARKITEAIKEKGLNRVIVAACTPRTHEPTFRDSLREAGLNPYLLEMTNIREHASWVHARERTGATEKAKDLIRMSLARALRLEELKEFELPVKRKALIVGGGIAGMNCALSIANQGYEVYLVEKERELGGMARKIYYTLEGIDVQIYLRDLINKVYKHPLIHIYTGARIIKADGYVGSFSTSIELEGKIVEITHGATIIATGAKEHKPEEYMYGNDKRIMTNLELEEKLARNDESLKYCNTIVIIQCVECRNEKRNYCSRVCCGESLKNALKLKELNPYIDVYILFRDMMSYGFKEVYYLKAARNDIRFIHYEMDERPQVERQLNEEGRSILRVFIKDHILGKRIALDADFVILASPAVPQEDVMEISRLFKVPVGHDGFFQEAHVKLRPVDFGTDGVYLCGMAQYPKYIPDAISQAFAAAGRVVSLLSKDKIGASGSVCLINEKKCIGCGACVEICAYGAISIYDTSNGKKARINQVVCKGDGLCNAKCPTGAIQLKHFTDEQLIGQIDAVTSNEEDIKDFIRAV
jgi:heterodisulfide reductase subunit A